MESDLTRPATTGVERQPSVRASSQGEAIRVRGLVQGVGFRPFAWRLAHECGVVGDIRNDAEGVLIQAWGDVASRERFRQRLRAELPPLARVDAIETTPLAGDALTAEFSIIASVGGAVHTGIVADAATCDACIADINDPDNRRYRYPFTNCTHCGPRLSIVRRIPYDRAHTSMAAFPMCSACQAEYDDPADRRFHAQPNACPDCGPRLWLEALGETWIDIAGDPITATQRLLRAGYIVAIKGLGGIHLACDAGNAEAVARLRKRKQRDDKPFALMARDVDMIRRHAVLHVDEEALLRGSDAPILLLEPTDTKLLAEGIAPRLHRLGFMLPYTPLHHLLVAGMDAPIVLTSGNRSDEPQCIGNDEARERLSGIADALLLHDREIVNRLDDSVVLRIADIPTIVRRARGHAPQPLRLPPGFRDAPAVLALGGELKNTFCLLKDGQAIVSQHLGDLENAAANGAWRETLELYLALFEHRPEVLAIDAHPEYLPSKHGRQWAATSGIALQSIQHHHAHIAACMADNGLEIDAPPVLGIALDGLGYGDDGSLWGGEFLLADYHDYRRLAALVSVAMPSGTQAIRQPWRMAYAHLRRACDWQSIAGQYSQLAFFRSLQDKPLATLDGMIDSGFNSPQTTSCGRLFDAVAALVGLRDTVAYEGQAAIELEAAVDMGALDDGAAYRFAIDASQSLPRLDPAPMWPAMLRDLDEGLTTGVIAARFHEGLAQGLAGMVALLSRRHDDAWGGRVALSGGVFQNSVLSDRLFRRLRGAGLQVLRHARVPANDGGLSLGQACIAASRTMRHDGQNTGRSPCA